VKDVIIALAATALLSFLFDITSREREDTVGRVFNFLEVPIAELVMLASYCFYGGGR
jgi:hypothetical protein